MDADFFISYTSKDKSWAVWIAWVLEEAGYKTVIQAWDFRSSNFVLKMHEGTTEATRTIAVITPEYFDSAYTKPEWAVAFAHDPLSEKGKLIPIRVADFDPEGLFRTMVYIDLVDLEETTAKNALLESIASIVKGVRGKPAGKPAFPSGTKSSPALATPPAFPGTSAASAAKLHNLPFAPNPFFTGREKMLEELRTALCKQTAAAITQPQAVHGLGGVGKTQLAVEYAWANQKDYDGIFWVGAATPSELHANLGQLADRLKLPEAAAREQEVKVGAVLNWLRESERWLLILDNADTGKAAEAVKKILSTGLRGHVIVTSRRTNWPVTFADLEVRVLPVAIAADFLAQRSAKAGFKAGTETEAETIAGELGGLPLALEQAGAYIAKHRNSFSAYHELLKTARARVLAEASAGGTEYDKTVATTWLVSEDQLSPNARAILQLAAFLAPEEIPRALFMENGRVLAKAATFIGPGSSTNGDEPIERTKIDDALAELAEHSLVELEAETFSCHRLLQAVLRDRLKPDEHKRWGQLAVKLVNTYAPHDSDDVRTWLVWNRLRPHAGTLLNLIGIEADQDAADLMNQLGLHLKAKALYGEAEALYRRGLAITEKHYGPEHPEVAIRLNNLAQLLKDTNRLQEAEPLMQRALAIDEKSFGPEHPEVATDLNNLAQLLKDTNRLQEAEPLMRRALAIDEKSFGPEHPNVAIRLNNLAGLLQATNRFSEAEPLMRQALAIDEKSFGPEHPRVARDLNNLAQLLKATNRLKEAEPLMRRALAIIEKSFGPGHPKVAICLNNLAQLLKATNRLQEAEPLMRRALAIDEKSFGPEHPEVATDLNNLARLLHDTNRLQEAEPLIRRALAIDEKSFGPEHPRVAIELNNLAGILEAANRREEAGPLRRRAEEIEKKNEER